MEYYHRTVISNHVSVGILQAGYYRQKMRQEHQEVTWNSGSNKTIGGTRDPTAVRTEAMLAFDLDPISLCRMDQKHAPWTYVSYTPHTLL